MLSFPIQNCTHWACNPCCHSCCVDASCRSSRQVLGSEAHWSGVRWSKCAGANYVYQGLLNVSATVCDPFQCLLHGHNLSGNLHCSHASLSQHVIDSWNALALDTLSSCFQGIFPRWGLTLPLLSNTIDCKILAKPSSLNPHPILLC